MLQVLKIGQESSVIFKEEILCDIFVSFGCCFFKMGSHHIDMTGLELARDLPKSLGHWN